MIRLKPVAIGTSLFATVLLTGAVAGRAPRPTASWTTELGTFTLLPTPDDNEAEIFKISPSGDSSVGFMWTRPGRPLATLLGYQTEDLTRVYRAFGFPTAAYSIRDDGDVVGVYTDTTAGGNTTHGFLFHEGEYSPIEFPGARETFVGDRNSSGTVVGDYTLPDGATHSFVYKDGTFESFDVPAAFGACSISSVAINSHGTIVGRFPLTKPGQPCGSPFRSFIRDADGTFTAYDATPDAISTTGWGINDRGDIVGYYQTAPGPNGGKRYGFLRPGDGSPLVTIEFPRPPGSSDAFGLEALDSIDGSGTIIVGNVRDPARGSGLPLGPTRPFKLTLCGAHCGNAP